MVRVDYINKFEQVKKYGIGSSEESMEEQQTLFKFFSNFEIFFGEFQKLQTL